MAESESKTRAYQTVRQLAYRPISLFAGLLLLFAAGMKAWQLATVPDLGEGVFHARWFNFLVVEFEIVLGLWLLFGFLPKQTRRLTIILFTGFAGVSLYNCTFLFFLPQIPMELRHFRMVLIFSWFSRAG